MARTELARVSRLTTLGELTASIAHEVNQPIGAMVTNAAACVRWLAAKPPDMAEAQAALANIVADGKRAGEVIARIRALTRRQAPRMELLDVNRKVREVLALAEHELKTHDIVLRTELAPALPSVAGDRVQLQQVLLNLIVNAIEAMSGVHDRARELTIVTAAKEPGAVVVEVRDSGPGLDEEGAERVFEPFYTTKAQGIGIGLSISRSIVEAHGGRLWAELERASRGGVPVLAARSLGGRRMSEDQVSRFVVDDDESMRRSLRHAAQVRRGSTPACSSSPQEFTQRRAARRAGRLVLERASPGMSRSRFPGAACESGHALDADHLHRPATATCR